MNQWHRHELAVHDGAVAQQLGRKRPVWDWIHAIIGNRDFQVVALFSVLAMSVCIFLSFHSLSYDAALALTELP